MKKVAVEYDEQSKAVTSKVLVEYQGEGIPDNDVILEETKQLFAKAQDFALAATMRRNK